MYNKFKSIIERRKQKKTKLVLVASSIKRSHSIVESELHKDFLINRDNKYTQCYECGTIYLKTSRRCPICRNKNDIESFFIFIDPVVFTEEYQDHMEEIEDKINKLFPEEDCFGLGNAIFDTRKQLYAEIGVGVRTNKEMNPGIIFE